MNFLFGPPSLPLPLKGGGNGVMSLGAFLHCRAVERDVAAGGNPLFTSPLEGEVGDAAARGSFAGRGVLKSHFSGLSWRPKEAAAWPPSPTRGEGKRSAR
jgi:hypothetical protein